MLSSSLFLITVSCSDSSCFILSRDHWNFISNFLDMYLFLVYDILVSVFHHVDATVISDK